MFNSDTNLNQRALSTEKKDKNSKGRFLMKAFKIITDIGWGLYKAYTTYEWFKERFLGE
ncbi:hypothetical protein [Photobacterium gaetbulicola]|uniref:hypothetical protein n=1 Tax=Photobacterium gaetbulicola TaxID=1295392 RepID=UPI000B179967|nr:hypothetical protein [Photobacterium gaetbulicola]